MKKSMKESLTNPFWYACLIFYAFIALFPFIWMFSSSFKPAQEVMAYPPTLLPKIFTFDNYIKAWSTIPYGRYLLNSIFITCVSTMSVVLTSSMAAYSLTILRVRGSSFITAIVMFGLIVPVQTSFIPVFIMAKNLGLIDTYTGVILPYLTSAFGIFMLSQFFKIIPFDLVDAARIDGLGELGIIRHVVIPLSKSGILTLIIFTFMNVWRDFFWPFLLLNRAEKRTVPLGIVAFWQSESPHYGIILAAATIAMIPLILVFAIFQKHFVQGISFSGLKQ